MSRSKLLVQSVHDLAQERVVGGDGCYMGSFSHRLPAGGPTSIAGDKTFSGHHIAGLRWGNANCNTHRRQQGAVFAAING